MVSKESNDIVSTLARLATDGADAARVGEVVDATMRAIDFALSPIIGSRGVSAVYRRSLFLIVPAVPWLEAVYRESSVSSDYASLRSAISEQTRGDAIKGAEALFGTLHALLVSLIGDSLTERLLRPMFKSSSSGDAVQEVSS